MDAPAAIVAFLAAALALVTLFLAVGLGRRSRELAELRSIGLAVGGGTLIAPIGSRGESWTGYVSRR